MLLQEGFLQGRQHLIGVAVEGAVVTDWVAAGNRGKVAIEQRRALNLAAGQICFKARCNRCCRLLRSIEEALVIVVQCHIGQHFADLLGQRYQVDRLAAQALGLLIALLNVAAYLLQCGTQAG